METTRAPDEATQSTLYCEGDDLKTITVIEDAKQKFLIEKLTNFINRLDSLLIDQRDNGENVIDAVKEYKDGQLQQAMDKLKVANFIIPMLTIMLNRFKKFFSYIAEYDDQFCEWDLKPQFDVKAAFQFAKEDGLSLLQTQGHAVPQFDKNFEDIDNDIVELVESYAKCFYDVVFEMKYE